MTVAPINKERAKKIREMEYGWGENLTDEEIRNIYIGSDEEFNKIVKTIKDNKPYDELKKKLKLN